MSLIIVGSYMVRYPLGGMMSWSLQWLLGLKRLGHEIVFVEKSNYADSCYDPHQARSSNDYTYGLQTTVALLERFGLDDGWCYVDYQGNYHGQSRRQIEDTFKQADLFLDLGTHGAWLEEAAYAASRVLVDGEPGYTQIRMEKSVSQMPQHYDHYFTNGANIGTARSTAPAVGVTWKPVYNPVVTELFAAIPLASDSAPYSSVMNWQSHQTCHWQGQAYGQKDIEFAKFVDLPERTSVPMEIAVSGKHVPADQLASAGWRVRDAQAVTLSYNAYGDYITACRGEFSVCKNVFVALNTGWFSDRSAAYLAHARPVVLQDTGFSQHLPVGEGLFAVRTIDEAAAAIEAIESDYPRHSRKAREIARAYLDAEVVLTQFLHAIHIA